MSDTKQPKKLVPGDIIDTNEGEPFGVIEDIILQPDNQKPLFLVTRLADSNDRLMLPIEFLDKKKTKENKVQLKTSLKEAIEGSLLVSGNTKLNYDQDSQSWRIPLAEERLQIEKERIAIGEVLVRKVVEQVEQEIPVALTHDEVVIQHIPINQVITAPVGPRQEGDWLIIPVTKEVLVIQKQMVVTEEIRIYKQAITEQQVVRDTVRQERVEIEDTSRRANPV